MDYYQEYEDYVKNYDREDDIINSIKLEEIENIDFKKTREEEIYRVLLQYFL